MTRHTSVTWKQKIIKARELRGDMGGLAFDRFKLMVEVFEDADFLHEHDGDEHAAMSVLDVEIKDTGCDFADARNLVKRFDEREAWVSFGLKKLIAQLESEAQQAAKGTGRKQTRVTKAQLEEAVRDRKHAEARTTFLEKEVDQQLTEVEQLRQENRKLQGALHRAEGRIEELERLLNREMATA